MKNEKLISIEIEEQDVGKRIDLYLAEFLDGFSRSRIQKLIKDENSVLVNSVSTKTAYNLRLGDIVEINMPDLVELALEPQDLNLDVVFENEDFLVVRFRTTKQGSSFLSNKEKNILTCFVEHPKNDLAKSKFL